MQSMPPHPFPKLPHNLVDDCTTTGPLYDIVMKASQLRDAKNMKALEWRNPQQRNLLMDILRLVRLSCTACCLVEPSLPSCEPV